MPAQAALVYLVVDRTDDVFFGGTDCQDAVPDDCSLRGAIALGNAIPPGDDVVIELAAEAYGLTVGGAAENGNATGDLDVLRDMTIQGQGQDETIVLAIPGFDDRIFDLHAGLTVSLVGLQVAVSKPAGDFRAVQARAGSSVTFTDVGFRSNGTALGGGGGLFLAEGVTAVLEHCRFENNETGLNGGAGIRSLAASLTVRDSKFLLNESHGSPGGAMLLLESPAGDTANLLERVLLEENRADHGGGLYSVKYTETSIVDSTLRGNEAEAGGASGDGGAIYTTGRVNLEGSTLHGNFAADHGPAIHAEWDGQPGPIIDSYNTTISGHRSMTGNAAVYFYSVDDSEFLNTTFYDNDLDVYGDSPFHMHVHNSVFGTGCVVLGYNSLSNGGNIGVDDSCWSSLPAAGDTVVANLMLQELGSYGGHTQTHLPMAGSPVLGASPLCPPGDQRGYPRPVANCASGAVERLDPEPVIFADGFESGTASKWIVSP